MGNEISVQQKRSERYWLDSIKDATIDSLIPPVFQGKQRFVLQHKLSPSVNKQLEERCNQNEEGIYLFLLTALQSLLYNHSLNPEVVITALPGKRRTGLNAVRFWKLLLNEKSRFADLLKINAKLFSEIKNHDSLDAYMLEYKLRQHSPEIGNTLWNTCFGYTVTDIECEWWNKATLSVLFSKDEDGIRSLKLSCLLSDDENSFAIDLMARYLFFIEQLLANPYAAMEELQLLPPNQQKQVVETFNATLRPYRVKEGVTSFFEEQTIKTPHATALVFKEEHMTYYELNTLSNQLANRLLRQYGIQRDDRVAVMMERSMWSVIGMLAIVKAGGCYVPIDHELPSERIRFILSDSNPKLLITHGDMRPKELFDSIEHLDLQEVLLHNESKENPGVDNDPDDLFFIIYTSGSTGNPKGVMQTHRTMTNLIEWDNQFSGLEAGLSILQYASFAFDASLHDIYFALSNGGCVHVLSDSIRLDFEALAAYIVSQKIQIVSLPFSVLSTLFKSIESDKLSNHAIRHIISTGEQLLIGTRLNDFLLENPEIWLHNFYGPSETHVVTASRFRATEPIPKRADIGKPISNTDIIITDKLKRLVPVGYEGEVYIGGDNLARGYVNLDALTTEKFIPHFFQSKKKLYTSGDLGRWLADGRLEYISRIDNQIKLRGYRVELGEIEKTLLHHAEVDDAIVVVQGEGEEKYLIAYLIAKSSIDIDGVRKFLLLTLPDYMIPQHIIVLSSYPLTPNGKVDKRKLPLPSNQRTASYAPAQTELEKRLVEAWENVLGKQPIGIYDNFFELGGHSLKASRISSLLFRTTGHAFPLRNFFLYPDIHSLARSFDETLATKYEPIPILPYHPFYEVSQAQKRLWLLSQMDTSSAAYNIPAAFKLTGKVVLENLQLALHTVVEQQASLRTVFFEEGGEVYQRILSSTNDTLVFHDLRNHTNPVAKSNALIQTLSAAPFNLSQGPLFHCHFIQIKEEEYVLLLNLHHIITDGTSMQLLLMALMQSYVHQSDKSIAPLQQPRIQYYDYAHWHNQRALTTVMKEEAIWWQQQLAGELTFLSFSNKLRPAVKTYQGSTATFTIDKKVLDKMLALRVEKNVTPFFIVQAALNILFYRYTGIEDQITGSPVEGRSHPEVESIIGFFVNSLVIRNRIEGHRSFNEILDSVRENMMNSLNHQNYPFNQLVEDLQLERDLSHSPLFEILIGYQTMEPLEMLHASLTVEPLAFENTFSKFDLTLSFVEQPGLLEVQAEYNTDIYSEQEIKNLVLHFEYLLEQLIDHPTLPIHQVNYMRREEVEAVLQFGMPAKYNPHEKENSLLEQLHASAARFKHKLALQSATENLTFEELVNQTEHISNVLTLKFGITNEHRVVVLAARSVSHIVASIGIIKSGALYIPLDPDFPKQRLLQLLSEIQPALVIHALEPVEFKCQQIALSELIHRSQGMQFATDTYHTNTSKILAVMYTSGSTGKPKGVMVPASGVIRLVCNNGFLPILEDDILLHASSPYFDASLFEIWGGLLNGATVYVATREEADNVQELKQMLSHRKISIAWFTAAWLNVLIDSDIELFASLTTVLAGGEALSPNHIKKLKNHFPQLRVINGYGPTENTTFTTTYEIGQTGHSALPIGKPIRNTLVYVLDSNGSPVPMGIPGNIYIAGQGLSEGYLFQEEETKRVFVNNPLVHTDTMYYTGDMGYWQEDGNLGFLGRRDDQVKIRGFRIELNEINQWLSIYPGITESLVLVRTVGENKMIVAYYAGASELSVQDIEHYLVQHLPNYMLPHQYIWLESFPLNSNGKINRNLLPQPTTTVIQEYQSPINSTEEKLTALWEDILHVKPIGRLDNFFMLGGHSLSAMRIISLVYKEMNRKISLKDFFISPTIAGLSEIISSNQSELLPRLTALQPQAQYTLSFTQQRFWFIEALQLNPLGFIMPMAYRLMGELQREQLNLAYCHMIQRHEILRTTFIELDGIPFQTIHDFDPTKFQLKYVDLTTIENGEERLQEFIRQEATTAFDLQQGPLIRTVLVQLKEQEYVFLLTLHHIIADGWSLDLMIKELTTTYLHLCSGDIFTPTPPESIQYKEYAHWQQQLFENGYMQLSANYWLGKFSGDLPVLELPTDFPRAQDDRIPTGGGAFIELSSNQFSEIIAFCKKENISHFIFFLSALKILLHRYTNQEDMVIGTPVAGREHPDIDNQIGLFINTLPLRTQFSAKDTIDELIAKVKETVVDGLHHQLYPFDKLVDDLRISRNTRRNPLFDVMFKLDRLLSKEEVTNIGDTLVLQPEPTSAGVSNFDLVVNVVEEQNRLQIYVGYDTSLFTQDYIFRMLDQYQELITQMVQHPTEIISRINFIPTPQWKELLSFQGAKTTIPEITLQERFEQFALAHPDGIAVIDRDKEYTYRQLLQLTNQVSNYLIDQKSVQPGEKVAVMMEHSVELLATLMGILRAGAIYVPVAPNFPEQRVKYTLEDSGAHWIIMDDELLTDKFNLNRDHTIQWNTGLIQTASNRSPQRGYSPEDVMCILYTSGSTGQPKGVEIVQRGVMNRIHWLWHYLAFDSTDRYLFKTTYIFDVSMGEIFMPICYGCQTLIFDVDTLLNPYLLVEALRTYNITTTHFSPTNLNGFIDAISKEMFATCDHLKRIFTSGEALLPGTVEKYFQKTSIPIYNLYGPTEASIEVSCYQPQPGDRTIPIGKPIDNVNLYILDIHSQQIMPIGVEGEICIGGVAVTTGYLNRPEQTAERFILLQQGDFQDRIYRTGDIGKWNTKGEIEFLGRKDNQVSIGGYRIELGEIEAAMGKHPDVQDACVIVARDSLGVDSIAAYMVPKSLPAVEHETTSLANESKPLSEEERISLKDWNNHFQPLPNDTISLIQWFDERVELYPEQIAVVFNNVSFSYQSLYNRSMHLSGYLKKKFDVQADDRIAILAHRSEEMLVALLAVMRFGAAFIPLDPKLPTERINSILQNANARILLKSNVVDDVEFNLSVDLQAVGKTLGEENFAPVSFTIPDPNKELYIIYTSGSTGKPKGVAVSYRNVHSVLNAWYSAYEFDSLQPIVLQIASFSFDVFIGDFFRSLWGGGTMIMANEEERLDFDALYQLIHQWQVNCWESTPALMIPFVEYLMDNQLTLPSMRLFILGSDVCPVKGFLKVCDYFGNQTRVLNSYGTTETTIDSCYYEMLPEGNIVNETHVPIGKPLMNTTCYILDEDLNYVALGQPGDLYIGGDGVAIGYVQQEELNARKFIQDKEYPQARMYHTGDRAIRMKDGNIKFLGRSDFQIKLRGFRIEVEEIEGLLQQHSSLSQAYVGISDEDENNPQLIAYYIEKEQLHPDEVKLFLASKIPDYMIPSVFVKVDSFKLTANGKIDRKSFPKTFSKSQDARLKKSMKQFLETMLPAYMIPSHFMIMDKFPMTLTGKTDRKALPPPHINAEEINSTYVEGTTANEILLTDIWKEILLLDKIGIHDNFFELGGHSLKATQVASRVYKTAQIKLALKDIFFHPTIQELADIMDRSVRAETNTILPAPVLDHYPVSFAQRRLWVLDQLETDSIAYSMPMAFRLTKKVNSEALKLAARHLVDRHESLRTSFLTEQGIPYQKIHPIGTSFLIQEENFSPDSDRLAIDFIQQAVRVPFNLEEGPLFRFYLIHTTEESCYVLLNMHHIISDGWSVQVILSNLMEFYFSIQTGKESTLSPLKLQYKDFSLWQQNLLRGQQMEELQTYWRQQFKDRIPVLNFPQANNRPPEKTYNGQTHSIEFDAELTAHMRAWALKHKSSMFMLLVTGVRALVYAYTRQLDVVIGTIHAGRDNQELENQVGYYLNTLPLRTRLDATASLEHALHQVRQTTLEAFEKANYPFDKLVDELNLQRDLSRSPLFDMMVILQNIDSASSASFPLQEFGVEGIELPYTVSHYDITFIGQEAQDKLVVALEYNTDLFDAEFTKQLLVSLENLFRLWIKTPGHSLESLSTEINPMGTLELKQEYISLISANPNTNEKETHIFETQVNIEPLRILFSKTLGNPQVKSYHNFFEAGGNSIRAIQLVSAINQQFQVKIRLRDIYNYPTADTLYMNCIAHVSNSNALLVPLNAPIENKATVYLIPPIIGNAHFYTSFAKDAENYFHCIGIDYPWQSAITPPNSGIETMAQEIFAAIVKHSPVGVIYLLGFSMGAILAYEVTKLLEEQHFQVNLILLDREALGEADHYAAHHLSADDIERMAKENFNHEFGPDMQSFWPTYRTRFFTLSKYQLRGKVNATIHAIEAGDNEVRTAMENWEKYTVGKFQVIRVPGTHATLFNKNYYQEVLNYIANQIVNNNTNT